MDSRLAERMEQQRKRHPEMAQRQAAPAQTQQPAQDEAQNTDAEWENLKKGKYAAQYGRDVQAAVQSRFKNQTDLGETLKQQQPILDALYQKHGIKAGDLEALTKAVLDDDSLYEDYAAEHGMTIEAAKTFKPIEDENKRLNEEKEAAEQRQTVMAHFQDLQKQAEKLKQAFPNFDLMQELNNPDFRDMTRPGSRTTVEQAYWAIHGGELLANAANSGVRRAQAQISQSIQANRKRPVEGAMNQQAAIEPTIDFSKLTREQRQLMKERARMGKGFNLP